MHDPGTPTALREQAAALRLHGLIEHWAEVMAQPEQASWVAQMLTWEATERGRSGKGPTLIEAKTYRTVGHHEGDPVIGTTLRVMGLAAETRRRGAAPAC